MYSLYYRIAGHFGAVKFLTNYNFLVVASWQILINLVNWWAFY